MLGLVAIVFSLYGIHQIDKERIAARFESCQLLRSLVVISTPSGKQKQAQQFIAKTPLRDCNSYAKHPTQRVIFQIHKKGS